MPSDRPTKDLMREFAKSRLTTGQVFQKSAAVAWFAEHYPNLRPTTVQMHVECMAVNSMSREHHPSIQPHSGHDLFFKVGREKFRLWDMAVDPAPIYSEDIIQGKVEAEEIDDEEEQRADALATEFAYERDLRNYLARNLNTIEPGLKLYEEEEITGIEFPVGNRYIDILAVGKDDEFVVVELKVSRGYDRAVGQILRYMAWIRENLAEDRNVRGVIVARQITDDLRLAVSMLPGVRLLEYELSFSLKAI